MCNLENFHKGIVHVTVKELLTCMIRNARYPCIFIIISNCIIFKMNCKFMQKKQGSNIDAINVSLFKIEILLSISLSFRIKNYCRDILKLGKHSL